MARDDGYVNAVSVEMASQDLSYLPAATCDDDAQWLDSSPGMRDVGRCGQRPRAEPYTCQPPK